VRVGQATTCGTPRYWDSKDAGPDGSTDAVPDGGVDAANGDGPVDAGAG
jgi:hypothetical protein